LWLAAASAASRRSSTKIVTASPASSRDTSGSAPRSAFSPFDAWGIQPYVSASIGGDRVLAVRREPNGSYECTTDGWVTECDPELERVFAAGYWGASLGYGGGIRIEPGRNGRLSFFLDVQHLFNRYGRRTSSQTGPDRLGTSAPRTQVITANVGVAFGF
jgi:hypothetical protein